MTKERRMYDKVNALGGLSTENRRGEGLRRLPDVVDHSDGVANIWEEDEGDKEEQRVAGNDGNSHARDSRLQYEAPTSSSVGTAEPGSDLDRFVENEFQFLDSDDDDDEEGEGRRSDTEAPLLGTLTSQQTEMLDQSPSPPSPQPSLTNLAASDPSNETLSSDLEEPLVTSRSSLSHESLDVDEVSVPDFESPHIPAPPPLPPPGVLFAANAKSATEQLGVDDGPKISHQPETMNGPEIVHGAGNVPATTRPKDRPMNEPQSPQNVLFLELQGILNRRLRKIDEDIERDREAESSIAAAAAFVPIKLRQESPNHQKPSDLKPPEQTAIQTDHHLNNFLPEAPIRTKESDVAENINSAIPHGSKAHIEDSPVLTLEGSNTNLLRGSASVEPPAVESFGCVLPDISDGGATEIRKEFSSRDTELDCRGTMNPSSQAVLVTGHVEELECQALAEARSNQTEAEERLDVPGAETVRTLSSDVDPGHEQLQSGTEAVALHLATSLASVPDVVTSSKPQSASVQSSDHLIIPPNHSEISPVVKRAEQVTRPRPSSSTAVYGWEAPIGDEWTPQMDLQDDEFDDDFPQLEMISRRTHQKRQDIAEQRRRQKRTPSKLYQKKQLGGPPRLANPGAFSLARINRAVKRVFGSISSKPSKQRAPISNNTFLQEDGWEIYPSRPYDQPNPGEAIKVVGVEKRPAYAYNAITRQLVILPDHDRILVTDDGRWIRDQNQQRSNGKTRSPSPGRLNASLSKPGNRDKPHFTSKSKASNPHPPNLNTKTVKSIHMHGRRESIVEDAQTAADDAYWRRNSSPNAASISSTNLSKRKTSSTLSQILSFRKSSNKSTANGKKNPDERMTASDIELLKKGGQATWYEDPRPV